MEALSEIAQKLQISNNDVEKIRQRFSYLEPLGIGAIDVKEAFLFQLQDMTLDDELYGVVEKLIIHFEAIESFNKSLFFMKHSVSLNAFAIPRQLIF